MFNKNISYIVNKIQNIYYIRCIFDILLIIIRYIVYKISNIIDDV